MRYACQISRTAFLHRSFFRGIQAANLAAFACFQRRCLLHGVLAMNGETSDDKEKDEVDDDVTPDDASENTGLSGPDQESDNVGDLSVEIDVTELVAKIEASDSSEVAKECEVRRRLDQLQDEHDSEKDLDSTYNFNLDDEL